MWISLNVVIFVLLLTAFIIVLRRFLERPLVTLLSVGWLLIGVLSMTYRGHRISSNPDGTHRGRGIWGVRPPSTGVQNSLEPNTEGPGTHISLSTHTYTQACCPWLHTTERGAKKGKRRDRSEISAHQKRAGLTWHQPQHLHEGGLKNT